MWTTQLFPRDFVLKLEFRAAVNADSGIFLRKPQLQCRDYLVAGPYKNLKNYKAQDWNTIEVTVTNNVARCVCNGEVLEEAFKRPETGPIGAGGRSRADGVSVHSDFGNAIDEVETGKRRKGGPGVPAPLQVVGRTTWRAIPTRFLEQ